MQKHVKNYYKHYGYLEGDEIMCEVCHKEVAVDIHHIQPRSNFGKKRKHLQDNVSNLIALCRKDHMRAHLQIEPYLTKEELQYIHTY